MRYENPESNWATVAISALGHYRFCTVYLQGRAQIAKTSALYDRFSDRLAQFYLDLMKGEPASLSKVQGKLRI